MSSSRLRRINKEIADCQNDKASGISVALVDSSPFHLIGTFTGPENSAYEGGTFDVDVLVPDNYPFAPLAMKFTTKVYHPNISSASGFICLDLLKDAWSPVLTLKSTLLSLKSLLCSPEPSDPQDAEVAKHFLSNRDGFEKTAKLWTQTYANGSESARPPSGVVKGDADEAQDVIALAGLNSADVEKFVCMGFPQDRVIEVLKRLNYRGANIRNVSDEAVLNELL